MAFIHKYSSISSGNSFKNGIINTCVNFKSNLEIIHPIYKETILGVNLRRMSIIVKMGLANTIKCSTNNKIDAIVVATGLGSIHNTELFLSSFIDSKQTILSPSPFINSVHNTISGEIALHTQNKGYNTTYSQGGLSFEGALLDTILLTKEGKNVILGGVDEAIPIIDENLKKEGFKSQFSSGSSFFNLSPNKKGSLAEIIDCTITKENKLESYIDKNFKSNDDIIISGFSTTKNLKEIKNLNYSKFSGIYMTNSSFGLQLAIELLNTKITKLDGFVLPKKIKNIFIINYASKNDIGIITIKK